MGKKEKLIIPKHIGFIMDGNRRWGRNKGLGSPIAGTAKGANTLEKVVEMSVKKGMKHITVFAFSKENWRRDKKEVDYLMGLLINAVPGLTKKLSQNGIKVNLVGRISDFPPDAQKVLTDAIEKTKNNNKATLNLAASYGGRQEIVDSAKKIIEDGIKPSELTEEVFEKYIYEAGQPDLDLIIRTGGMQRLSGFMMWQSTYSELYFTEILWPDFNEKELEKAILFYNNSQRNFGK